MKYSTILLLPVLSSFVNANPIANANPGAVAKANVLEARDRWCWLKDTYNSAPCKKGAGTAYDTERTIYFNGPNFGVSCKAYDTRENTWLKIPGWNCWLQAKYAVSSCASKLYNSKNIT